MSENFAMFCVKEQEEGKLELQVEGSLAKLAALLASAMDDDPDIEKVVLLALMAVEHRKAEEANKAQMN